MGLIDKMNEFKVAQAVSMHVPGHKNKTIGNLNEIELSFDMTEIPGLDNLHSPTEVLKELNNKLSKKYEGYYAQALVNGSTTGILSGLHSLYTNDSTIYVVGEAHKAIYHAAELLGTTVIEVPLKALLKAGLKPSDIVVFTYPSYSGEIFDISSYIEFVQSKDAKVLIDEAHGAHFDITPRFPQSALNFSPNIVVQSYHKGLPSLTGSSVIFVKDKDIHRKVMKYIDIFETSSPSYLSLLSIESGHAFYEEYDDEVFFLMRESLLHTLKANGIEVKEVADPAKLILKKEGTTPYELEWLFREKHIYSEMTTDDGVLWCLPLWHDGDIFPFELLLERINVLNLKSESNIRKPKKKMDVSVLKGKKAVRKIVPYPPGVPIMHEGEIFTPSRLEVIMQHRENNVKIEGLEDNLDYYTER